MGTVSLSAREKGSAERSLLPAVWSEASDNVALNRVLALNQVIKHNFRYDAVRRVTCAQNGCQSTFEITLIPHQVLYPKFCEKHRSEYQRDRIRKPR